MKTLNLYKLTEGDNLRLSFNGAFNGQSQPELELESFLRALEREAGDWMPNAVGGKRRSTYSRANFWKALEEARDEDGSTIGFFRTALPALDMMLGLHPKRSPPELDIAITVHPLSLFAETERCRAFVAMVHSWASYYPVIYASAHSMADRELAGSPSFGRDDGTWMRDGFDKVYEVFWLNVFGPRLVETVGRERMLSTPAHRVEELPGGAILLVTWPTAADFAREDSRQAQARALVHLRPELDYATVLRRLRERSATLAPVEPRFHPDVAPLLSRALVDVAISQRQRKIAEYNAWQPPEPEEWRPAESALPVDVDEPEKWVEFYHVQSERLIALLHKKVPSVLEQTPESLTDVDFHLWYDHYPETFERERLDKHLVPAVGAYLGEVLVKHLGGRWLPRKSLGEAQVLVGQRVWYPFQRAWRYLRTRQSLLEASLTQVYRVAEGHRG